MGILSITPSYEFAAHGLLPHGTTVIQDPHPLAGDYTGPRDGPRTSHFIWDAATGGAVRLVDAGTESDRITALLSEQVDVISMSVANAKQYVEDGQMKVLAVINSQPDPMAPDFPTTTAEGLDFSLPLVMTVYGPEKVDDDVKTAFTQIVKEIEADPEFATALQKQAQVPALRTPEQASEFLSAEQKTIAGLLGK